MTPRFTLSPLLRSLVAAGLFTGAAVHGESPAAAPPGSPTQTARPAVGTPLVQAQTLVTESRYVEALAKVAEAEKAAADPTPYERYIVQRVKAAAALGAGQTELAFTATEAAIATGWLSGDAQLGLIESLVHSTYRAKDYARAARWAARYAESGGSKVDVAALRIQAMYLGGDHAGAAAALNAKLQADDAAGRATSERELQLLASAQRHLGDATAVARSMELLATRYPKPAYWAELLARIDRRTLSDRLFLDFFRLSLLTGNLTRGEDHVTLAQLALSAAFPGEALAVLDEAAAKGLVGSGPDAAQHQALHNKARQQAAEDAAARQRDEAAARSARDGNGLVMLGQSAAAQGRFDHGIALIEQGLAKGGLRRPDEARLRLGEAQAMAGRGSDAAQTLAGVKGPAGLTELARLWALYATSPRLKS